MNACVALTVFAVMFGIGLGVAPREWREALRRPGPMLRALSAVLVVVPALALAVHPHRMPTKSNCPHSAPA